LLDLEHSWPEKCGVEAAGAVLVRPDTFVAWRSPTLSRTPASLLEQVLSHILARLSSYEEGQPDPQGRKGQRADH
jgi:putative polyketide hydroxylase